jgi:hypothetical protein
LRSAGFRDVAHHGFMIDCSHGTSLHAAFRAKWSDFFSLTRPFLLESGAATEKDLSEAYETMQSDFVRKDFSCIANLMTAWGYKA